MNNDHQTDKTVSNLPSTVSDSAAELMTAQLSLSEESRRLLSQIIAERDADKSAQLTHLFNLNQNKKTLVRLDKFSDLLDTIAAQAYDRFTSRPDEISNKELLDGMKVMQDLLERGRKQVVENDEGPAPLIQINQTNNEVNMNNAASGLSRESRAKVQKAVSDLLKSMTVGMNTPIVEEDPIEGEVIEIIDAEGDE